MECSLNTEAAMNLKDLLIPDEWQSAPALIRSMVSVVGETSHAVTKHIAGMLLPFFLGFLIGSYLPLIDTVEAGKLVRGILTVAGILAGFMVTLMVFTGRTEKTDLLDYESAKKYRNKVIYLLWSQTLTLFANVATVIAAIIWFYVTTICDDSQVLVTLTSTLFGFLAIALSRSILLPLQIFELHQFTLDFMVEEKLDKLRKIVKEQDDD